MHAHIYIKYNTHTCIRREALTSSRRFQHVSTSIYIGAYIYTHISIYAHGVYIYIHTSICIQHAHMYTKSGTHEYLATAACVYIYIQCLYVHSLAYIYTYTHLGGKPTA